MESLFSQSLLFLGCSLDKDRTLQCMAEIVEERGKDNLPKHYAFLSCENLSDKERTTRRKVLQNPIFSQFGMMAIMMKALKPCWNY